MEKKGTKIAYFVALAVVVVALVIAKVTNDGSGFVGTGWALFPPVVAIALALISKEVYSSLFLGCVAAALLLAGILMVMGAYRIFSYLCENARMDTVTFLLGGACVLLAVGGFLLARASFRRLKELHLGQ